MVMNPVGLLSLAVSGASLSTVFAYRRFLDDGSLATDGRPVDPDGAVGGATAAGGGVRCPYCGSENDVHPSVTFCRRCLGSTGRLRRTTTTAQWQGPVVPLTGQES